MTKAKAPKQPTQKKLTNKKRLEQMGRQMKMLYDMLMETREVMMNLTHRYEEMKIRSMSEWEAFKQVMTEDHGMLEEDLEKILGDHFTKNVDRYNEFIAEKTAEMEAAAQAQAEEVTKEAEAYMEEAGITVEETKGEDVVVTDESLKEASSENDNEEAV